MANRLQSDVNATPVVIVDSLTGNPAANSGTVSTPTTDGGVAASGQTVNAQNFVYNGTSWDRSRGDTSGQYIAANFTFTETTTVLAANASFTSAARVTGSAQNTRFSFFISDVFADVAGTLFVERSVDGGTTWYPANGVVGTAVAAGQSVQVKVPLSGIIYRSRYVNGGTAQGRFLLTSALSLN